MTIKEGTNDNSGVEYEIGLNNENITLGDDTNNGVIEGIKGDITAAGTISAGQRRQSDDPTRSRQ